ncbi:MAG: outer membrane protein assembly factor BamA [Oligoflexales bacterium]
MKDKNWFKELFLCCLLGAMPSYAEKIQSIIIQGNAKVEQDAILLLMKTKVGQSIQPSIVQQDIRELYTLGYFSNIQIDQRKTTQGLELRVTVQEKPAISAIEFQGLDQLTEEDLADVVQTKVFTIIHESTITNDLQLIEKQYAQKGYYLASIYYELVNDGKDKVKVVFHVHEGQIVKIGSVDILGNHSFSTTRLLENMLGKPSSRSSAFGSASLYQEAMIQRDAMFLDFYYRDKGYAEVKVEDPQITLDPDQAHVRIVYQLEEGLQYTIDQIEFQGDLLYPKEELLEWMQLKSNDIFSHSKFIQDIEMLKDKYGDFGFAYADINPIPQFDRKNSTVKLKYNISKGEKVYFGRMKITGNTKTRDNVIRRELKIHDSELYSGTKLTESRQNIQRLGFFEQVKVLRERDHNDTQKLNLNFKVEEKRTGQLNLSLGYNPASGGNQANLFGTGTYEEKNQFGRGWAASVKAETDGKKKKKISLGFANPRVYDSHWSTRFNLALDQSTIRPQDKEILQHTRSGSTQVGRTVLDLAHLSFGYEYRIKTNPEKVFILDQFNVFGTWSSLWSELHHQSLDNNLDPNSGLDIALRHTLTGGPIGGDFQYMETKLVSKYYIPVRFTESFINVFRIHMTIGRLWSFEGEPLPAAARYKLGGQDDMRGFNIQSIGPTYQILRAPGGPSSSIVAGGDKHILFQFEYFIPLLPEAGIKSFFFADVGQVFANHQQYSLNWESYYKDIGFGFRWMTPIGPMRFEWAYPIQNDGRIGGAVPIIKIGI